jgi:ATP-dependent RNA helicase DDX5/DBP2
MSSLGGGLKTIDWGAQKIERFEKNFYAEDKRVASRTDKEVEDFRRGHQIKVWLIAQSHTDRPY